MAIADSNATYENEQDAADAFLKLFDEDARNEPSEPEGEKEEDPSETTEAEETTEDADAETPSDESGEEEAAEAEEETKSEKKYADDEGVYTKIKVGNEEHEVQIKDLKRLFGQEASLTKKSQEVAERTKAAEQAQAKSLAALDVMVKRAQETANPYRNVNWASLMKDPSISAEDVDALQEAARAAFENEAFLTTQLDGFMQEVQAQQQAAQAEAAKACIKALTDEKSPTYIKGWDQKLYDDMRSFAVSMGASQQMVNNLVDPSAFKLIHMAMQFHKGTQNVVTQKVNKAPKKIVKSSTTSAPPSRETNKAVNRQSAVAKQKKAGGSMQSTEDAFLALLGGDK